ncbi:M14 family zinc carboxypeptidase [Leucobacter sp. 1207-22]|uniref:M14 family zinc carboxypeptidase n=1 Tax=Leucobacter sp. 1207-22 TaxID=2604456 RepID=UPI0040649101
MASRRLLPASAISALLVGGLSLTALTPAAATPAPDTDAPLLITVDAAQADAVADLDVVDASADQVVILGDDATEQLLEDRGVAIDGIESYAAAISTDAAPTARSAATADAVATASFPVPEKLDANDYETYYGGYRTVAAFDQYARDIAAAYPDIAELVDFGDSWQKTQGTGGHDLLAVRLTGNVADQPTATNGQEGRPRFVLVAQAHARELITSEIAWRYAAELLDGYGTDPQITALLDSTEVWINFQNNPDSIEAVEAAVATAPLNQAGDAVPPATSKAWQRKNANTTEFAPTSQNWNSQQHGVDLNRNWAFHWGEASSSTNPNSASYRGTAPASEPEIEALSGLLTDLFGEYRTENDTAAPAERTGTYVNLHSYANYVIYPYAYDKQADVPNLEPIKASAFRQSFANDFATGKAGEILYDNSGNDIDWIYSQLGVPAYTYEIGTAQSGGFFPSYARVDDFYTRVAPGIRFAAEAAYAPYTATLGGIVSDVTATRSENGAIAVSGTATDDAYGADPSSVERRPEVTEITAVEAALATNRNAIDKTVPLTIEGSGHTVSFAGEIPVTRDTASAHQVFVRAQNGSGEWGPWQAAAADALAAPTQSGSTDFTVVAGSTQSLDLGIVSSVTPAYEVLAGKLPKGLAFDAELGAITGSAQTATTASLRVRIDNGAGEIDVPITLTVTPAQLDEFVLALSDQHPTQGDTITVTATGIDEFGNEIADYSDRVKLTSDVDTDVIDGNRVTFPTASPHTITATAEGVSTSILVQVRAANGESSTDAEGTGTTAGTGTGTVNTDNLARTGGPGLGLLLAAAGALGLTGALVLARRKIGARTH